MPKCVRPDPRRGPADRRRFLGRVDARHHPEVARQGSAAAGGRTHRGEDLVSVGVCGDPHLRCAVPVGRDVGVEREQCALRRPSTNCTVVHTSDRSVAASIMAIAIAIPAPPYNEPRGLINLGVTRQPGAGIIVEHEAEERAVGGAQGCRVRRGGGAHRVNVAVCRDTAKLPTCVTRGPLRPLATRFRETRSAGVQGAALGVEEEAAGGDDRGRGAGDLPFAGAALQLVHRLADVAGTLRAPFRERAAVRVDRYPPVDQDAVAGGVPVVLDERARLARARRTRRSRTSSG